MSEDNKIETLKKSILHYADNPNDYFIDVLKAIPEPEQKVVLDALPQAIKEKKGISVKSGHGVGKTMCQAGIIKWFIDTRPFPKIIATAGSQKQLKDVLWPELHKWHKKSITADLCEWTQTQFYNKIHKETWFASARTSNNPDNMAGIHADHVLFVIDEASAVDDKVMEVIEGSQTQDGSLIVMFGNPTQISGGFFDAFNSKRKFFLTFTFNSENSRLVSKEWCEKQAAKYGKDSDFYRVRVLGKFPKSDPDTLIPIDMVELAAIRDIIPLKLNEYEIIEIGVDVARFGDDETTIYSRIGNIIKEEKILRKKDNMWIAGEVKMIAESMPWKHIIVNVDVVGVGSGVVDRLVELKFLGEIKCKSIEIVGVNNGEKAKDPLYVNVGTEMWWKMKGLIKDIQIPNDNDLIAQLSGRKYKMLSKQVAIEPKADMKKRGLQSPDRADGIILTLRSLIYSIKETDWGTIA